MWCCKIIIRNKYLNIICNLSIRELNNLQNRYNNNSVRIAIFNKIISKWFGLIVIINIQHVIDKHKLPTILSVYKIFKTLNTIYYIKITLVTMTVDRTTRIIDEFNNLME